MSSNKDEAQIEQTYELLIGCMMQAKHRLVSLAGDFNITGMQAMMVLLLSKPTPMNSFTKIFNCDASNITGIVDGLEQRELASRFPDNKDRRIKMIKLSARGEKLREQFLGLLVEDKKSGLSSLDKNEMNILNALLKKASGLMIA